MVPSTADGLKTFGLPNAFKNIFYNTVDEVMNAPNGQAHYMRRAFLEMDLDGILCIDGKPTVYLKDYKQPVTRKEVNEQQKKFWNQGTGTLLVIQDPSQILMFSGMVAPNNDDGAIDEHAAFIERLDRVAHTLEKYQLVEQVASGHYYRTHSAFFNSNNAVDQYLLDNLRVLGDMLCRDNSKEERKRVHSLLGRIIFTCYLIDRKIIILQDDYSFIRKKSVERLVDLLENHDPAQARKLLYELFTRLRGDFNGSMFDDDLDAEQKSVTDDDIDTLKRFFRGDSLKDGQRTLGFWAYDFSIIPVETISALYEEFLESEDTKDKEAKGAFYTPRHLAEMVVDEALGSLDTILGKKCLDPACGSGIFLAILFNRMACEWQQQNPRAQQRTKKKHLLDILESKLFGVDVNQTACRIACFSLYIAFLDQFLPATLRELQKEEKLLPKLLAFKKDGYRNTSTPTILEGNFFDPQLPIENDFDIVIGNPPWVGRNQPADKEVEEWVFGKHNPFIKDAPKAKSSQKAIFLPQNQLAHAFMWKAPLCLKEDGHASFLLPSEILLNKTDAFQGAWFGCFQVNRVLHLADYRKFLFSGATRPCFIANYQRREPDLSTHRLEYVVPKVCQQDPRSGVIPVASQDRKWISLQELLNKASESKAGVLWKSYLWGTARDVRFLEYLSQLDTLNDITGEPSTPKRWLKGQGFQPWYQIGFDERPDTYGKPKPIPGKLSDSFLATVDDRLQMFVLQEDCISLETRLKSLRCKGKPLNTPENELKASLKGFRRSPDAKLFQPPLVLVNKGFTKFAFVDFPVFYQHSLTGIGGNQNDKDLLRFFTVYVKSKLASYFLFHTAGSWGTERDEVRVHELLRLPFLLPDSPHASPRAVEIVKKVALLMKKLQKEIEQLYTQEVEEIDGRKTFKLTSETTEQIRKRKVEKLQADLEPLIYDYFDLSDEEKILIEDTSKVYEPSSTPATPNTSIETLKSTSADDRIAYSSLLCDTLNKWSELDQPKGKKQPFFLFAESALLDKTGMVLVTIKKAKKKTDSRDIIVDEQVSKAIERIAKASTKQQGTFAYLRGVIFGDGDRIHIVKPDLLGHWTRTYALNDADMVFQAIIQSKQNRK